MRTAEAVLLIEDWLRTTLSDGIFFLSEADLFFVGDCFLIVKTDDGLKYTNQTGGHACNHPSQRGLLIQLNRNVVNPEVDGSGWWSGDAKKFFDANPSFYEFLEPNGESEEAWIQVKLKGTSLEAILAYPNSD